MTTAALLLERKVAGLCRCGDPQLPDRSRCAVCDAIHLFHEQNRRGPPLKRGPYLCGECLEPGHNRQRCPKLHPELAPAELRKP